MKTRDISSTVLLYIAILTSVLTILDALYLVERFSGEKSSEGEYKNTVTIQTIYPEEAISGGEDGLNAFKESAKQKYEALIEEISSIESCNIIWTDRYLDMGSEYTSYLGDLILSCNETLKISTQNGVGFSMDAYEENEVIIGESLLPFTFEKDGRTCITVNESTCSVVDVLENDVVSGVDTRILVNYISTTDDFRDTLLLLMSDVSYYTSSTNFVLEICSDGDVNDTVDQVMNVLENAGFEYGITETDLFEDISETNYVYKFIKRSMVMLAFAFAVCACLTTSYIWVSRRRRELVVRRIFGFGILNIMARLSRELLPLIAAGLLTGILLFGLWNGGKGLVTLFTGFNPLYFIGILVGVCVCLALCILAVSVKELCKDSLIDELHR